ncbi:MAG: HD-GYP domain-containing protein [Candidatus Aminicenantia bacterium]
MNKFKEIFLKHFEKFIIFIILASLVIINSLVLYKYKLAFLNVFYLPVLLAGYYSGKKLAISTSVFSVLIVTFYVILFPSSFFPQESISFDILINLTTWASFLILAGIMIGILYEQKENKIKDLKEASLVIFEILSNYLTSLDKLTREHSLKIANLSAEIASHMKLSRSEVENIRIAAFLHDFGKTETRMALLQKTAQIIDNEKKLSTFYSAKETVIIQALDGVLKEAVPLILAYNRYYINRSDSLKEDLEDIPIETSIIALAENYFDLITDKPDQPAKSSREAQQLIEQNSDILFPSEIVEAFKRSLVFKGIY